MRIELLEKKYLSRYCIILSRTDEKVKIFLQKVPLHQSRIIHHSDWTSFVQYAGARRNIHTISCQFGFSSLKSSIASRKYSPVLGSSSEKRDN